MGWNSILFDYSPELIFKLISEVRATRFKNTAQVVESDGTNQNTTQSPKFHSNMNTPSNPIQRGSYPIIQFHLIPPINRSTPTPIPHPSRSHHQAHSNLNRHVTSRCNPIPPIPPQSPSRLASPPPIPPLQPHLCLSHPISV